MSEANADRALEALRRSIQSGRGSRRVEISLDPLSERFEVEVFSNDRCCYAAGPTLDLALLAAGKLENLDSVVVDHAGHALCLQCGGKTSTACSHCKGTGRDPEPPHNWPAGGVLA